MRICRVPKSKHRLYYRSPPIHLGSDFTIGGLVGNQTRSPTSRRPIRDFSFADLVRSMNFNLNT